VVGAVLGKVVISVIWWLLAARGEVTLLPVGVAVSSGVAVVVSCVDDKFAATQSATFKTCGRKGNHLITGPLTNKVHGAESFLRS
jgi:hypothetical protein